jgi:hypothetical protein
MSNDASSLEGFRIRPLGGSEDDLACTRFLEGRLEATLYHSLRYRDLLLAMLAAKPEYLAAWRGGRVVGVLPAMAMDGPFGTIINSLPFFGSHGGVIAEDEFVASALWTALRERIAVHDVVAATVIQNPFSPEPMFAYALPAALADSRIGQATPLAPSADGGARDYAVESSARRNIRKAQLAGVRVRVQNGAIDYLAETHRANMSEIGGTPKPPSFFKSFPRVFRADEDYRLYVAELDGSPIGGLLMFYYRHYAEYIMPVTTLSFRHLHPTAAILHHAMNEAAAEGRRIWNWGGTWLNQIGVYRFKRKWGAQDSRYHYAIALKDESLLDRSASELQAAYPYFYVVPFSALHRNVPIESSEATRRRQRLRRSSA